MRRTAVLLAVAAFGVNAPRKAHANGRLPEAQRLVEYPADPKRLYLAATYGLLVTEDRGRNWYYICELAFALEYLQGDPLLEIMPDGSLLGGIFETENMSRNCGCDWTTVLGESPTQIVIDVARDGTGAVIAVVRDDAALTSRVMLFESTDAGNSWRRLSDLPNEVTDAYTVDVAPSDPTRI